MLKRSDDAALLLGRMLVAALLLPTGIDKLLHFSRVVASFAARGLPYPKVWAGFQCRTTSAPASSRASRSMFCS